MFFCCLHWWDNYHFFSSPWCIPTIILVADHNPWPFCSQDSITKTGFHYLTYLLWNLRKHGSMRKGTSHAVHMHRVLCSWAAELHSRQRRKVGPTLGIYGGQPQLAGHHPAHAFCEPGKQLVDLYAFVCCCLWSAAWPNVGESVADHSCSHLVCPHSTKQKHQRLPNRSGKRRFCATISLNASLSHISL